MDTESFRETLYTINKRGERKWVYPAIVRGSFRRARTLVSYALVLFYLVLPWITINGRQAVLLNIFERKFTIFGVTFWATDATYLFLLLGSLALTLFFFTALFGRVWCGWACPETVFLEFIFRPFETFIEGSAVERRRLDDQECTARKLARKGAKWLVFATLAWILASTALAYFFGREPLIAMMMAPPWHNLQPFLTTLFLMGLLLFQFGWFREQFCSVLCPYARFQSVLLDSDSLLVGYDSKRGEPRGKVRGHEDSQEPKQGDCIDCGLCVRVCPTGIDIRNGLQLECIQCAACIDACDSIMDKIGKPRGLVRYDTETGLDGQRRRILRPRVFIYGLLLISFLLLFTALLTTRQLSEFQIIRVAQEHAFTRLPTGEIANQFKVHISNKSGRAVRYYVRVEETAPVTLTIPSQPFPVEGESLATIPLFVTFPEQLLERGTAPLDIRVEGDDGFLNTQKVTLLGPE